MQKRIRSFLRGLVVGSLLSFCTAAHSAEIRGTQSTPALQRIPVSLKVEVDLSRQKMLVLENGDLRYAWHVSSGKSSEFPTPVGTFTPEWMTPMWYSRQWSWTPMPYAIFINEGVAIHGTAEISKLGRPASKGCIRLSPANAKTLFRLVSRHGMKATRVTILGKPAFAEQRLSSAAPSSSTSLPNTYPQKSSARPVSQGSAKNISSITYTGRYPKRLEVSKSPGGSISLYGGF